MLSDEEKAAARELWEAATWNWNETDGKGEPIPLEDQLFESSIANPGRPIRGKELYRIGLMLGFPMRGGPDEL